MARRNKPLSIYPDPQDRAIVGANTPACNQAINCWARTIRENQPELERAEWNFLADVLNGAGSFLEAGLDPWVGPQALCLEIHDAQSLNHTGDRWFGEELEPGSGQEAVKRLLAKVETWTWQQLEACMVAIRFFWTAPYTEQIDHADEDWWTPAYRVGKVLAQEGSTE